jgi:hypothetical protein
MKKRGKVDLLLRKKVSNRLSYTIIAVVALILVSAGVYAATGWTSNQPSHDTLWAQIIKGKDVDTIDIVDTNLNITSPIRGGTLNAAKSIITLLISTKEIFADAITTNTITAKWVSTDNFIYNGQRTNIFDKISFPDDTKMIVSSKIIGSSSDNSPYIIGYVEGVVGNTGGDDHIVGYLPYGDGTRCIVFLQGYSDEHCTKAFMDCKYSPNYGGLASCWLEAQAGNNIVYGAYAGDDVGAVDGYVRCGYLCW